MTTRDLPAIDVHGHYGQYHVRGDVWGNHLMTADAATVAQRAQACNIELTVVSPLLGLHPRGEANAAAGNEEAARVVPATAGLARWVIVDPQCPETYQQAEEALTQPDCLGIKIHPEEHVYPIREHGQAIFEFAARHGAVVLTHSGEANSLPEDCVPFANDFPEVTLILAHIGCGFDGDRGHQVRAVQASRHGNVYADTSSMMSIMPGLIEWAVAEIGADRVLFGTDTPLYSVPMQRARIDEAELSEADKRRILHDNAVKVLKLEKSVSA